MWGLCLITSLYLLYNRGVPDTGGNMEDEFRPPKAKPLVLSFGLTFMAGALGACASQVLYGFLRMFSQGVVIAACTSAFFCLSAHCSLGAY